MEKLIDGLLKNLASKGRYGDTELAHVNEKEASLLKSLGGAGTINPKTGLKEYHLPEGFYTALWNPLPFPYGTTWAQNRFEDMHGYRYEGPWPISGDFDDKMGTDAYRIHQERHGYTEPEEPVVEPQDLTEEQRDEQESLIDTLGKLPTGDWTSKVTHYEDWTDVTPEELAKYVNPETGEITDENGLIRYMRKVNPELAEYNDDGSMKYDREDILKWSKDLAPDVFASREDIAKVRGDYESSAALSREKAKEARLESSMASGISGISRPGQYGFGGSDESITKGLYADIGAKRQDYITGDLYGLETEATEDYGDFIYGLTGPEDSAWYQAPHKPS